MTCRIRLDKMTVISIAKELIHANKEGLYMRDIKDKIKDEYGMDDNTLYALNSGKRELYSNYIRDHYGNSVRINYPLIKTTRDSSIINKIIPVVVDRELKNDDSNDIVIIEEGLSMDTKEQIDQYRQYILLNLLRDTDLEIDQIARITNFDISEVVHTAIVHNVRCIIEIKTMRNNINQKDGK